MYKLLFLLALVFTNCNVDVPVDKDDIDEMKVNLEKCVSNLELAQLYLIQLSDDLQKCIDQEVK